MSNPSYDYMAACRRKAAVLSQAKRQEFMDNIFKGMMLGDAREAAGIGFDEALAIIDANIVKSEILSLNREVQ